MRSASCLQAILAAGDEDELGAGLARDPQGGELADAAGRAGDEGDHGRDPTAAGANGVRVPAGRPVRVAVPTGGPWWARAPRAQHDGHAPHAYRWRRAHRCDRVRRDGGGAPDPGALRSADRRAGARGRPRGRPRSGCAPRSPTSSPSERLLDAYCARCAAVPADLLADGLGLRHGDREAIAERCDEVVHCAASVTFDLPLDARARGQRGGRRAGGGAGDAGRASAATGCGASCTSRPPTWRARGAGRSARTTSARRPAGSATPTSRPSTRPRSCCARGSRRCRCRSCGRRSSSATAALGGRDRSTSCTGR